MYAEKHAMNRVIEFNGFYLDMGAVTIEQMIILFVGFSIIFFASYKLIVLIYRLGSIILNAIEIPANSVGNALKNILTTFSISLIRIMKFFKTMNQKKKKVKAKQVKTNTAMATAKAITLKSSPDKKTSDIDEKLMLIPAYARKEVNKHYPIYN
ncbi:hypothetical protein ABT56_19030 [Photobacterium aquae]|uniref:Uncharacterized protein n=1 Tax=Photobacterium aquae TaxID=1195763 RepID=A0A0J1GUW4_9GAMM|nr:hypothetical protein [Photobacterium aquae]KLV03528.1 hypothetical protein ABT56_19030 [Photobacterium aquae]